MNRVLSVQSGSGGIMEPSWFTWRTFQLSLRLNSWTLTLLDTGALNICHVPPFYWKTVTLFWDQPWSPRWLSVGLSSFGQNSGIRRSSTYLVLKPFPCIFVRRFSRETNRSRVVVLTQTDCPVTSPFQTSGTCGRQTSLQPDAASTMIDVVCWSAVFGHHTNEPSTSWRLEISEVLLSELTGLFVFMVSFIDHIIN